MSRWREDQGRGREEAVTVVIDPVMTTDIEISPSDERDVSLHHVLIAPRIDTKGREDRQRSMKGGDHQTGMGEEDRQRSIQERDPPTST